MERPVIEKAMDPELFLDFYYLKEELIEFCKEENIPSSGNKKELTERIVNYMKNGEVLPRKSSQSSKYIPEQITANMIIEENLVCSEVHRKFFLSELGPNFKFKVAFQKWLKENHGKTYADAITIYPQLVNKKPEKIESQFEYNTYIRDFFLDNKGNTLQDAIKCWNYKKNERGHNRYEISDLNAF